MQELFNKFADNVDSNVLLPLANQLGVWLRSLQQIGVGLNPMTGAYVIPERNEKGKIIGISQRALDGKKWMITGS